MKKLNPSVLRNISNQLNYGLSSRAIARRLSVGKSSVNRYRESSASTDRNKGGAPQKLIPSQKQAALLLITRGKAKTAVEAARVINEGLDKKVSVQTVRRALRELGYDAKKKVKKPALTLRHRQKRYK